MFRSCLVCRRSRRFTVADFATVVDLAEFYPAAMRPQFTLDIRDFHVRVNKDRFFMVPPFWFKGLMFLELVYHLPLSIWAVPALLRSRWSFPLKSWLTSEDDPLIPLHLLVFALEAGVSTYVCTLEMFSWEGYSWEEQKQLCSLYMPYLALGKPRVRQGKRI